MGNAAVEAATRVSNTAAAAWEDITADITENGNKFSVPAVPTHADVRAALDSRCDRSWGEAEKPRLIVAPVTTSPEPPTRVPRSPDDDRGEELTPSSEPADAPSPGCEAAELATTADDGQEDDYGVHRPRKVILSPGVYDDFSSPGQRRRKNEKFVPLDECASLGRGHILLTESRLEELRWYLPVSTRFASCWKLIYCPRVHGVSIRTFFRQCQNWPGETLVMAEDTDGYVFGGFATHTWQVVPAHRRCHYGGLESFVFTFGEPGATDCRFYVRELLEQVGLKAYLDKFLDEGLCSVAKIKSFLRDGRSLAQEFGMKPGHELKLVKFLKKEAGWTFELSGESRKKFEDQSRKGMQGMRVMLEQIGLKEYAQKLELLGYDDIDLFVGITARELRICTEAAQMDMVAAWRIKRTIVKEGLLDSRRWTNPEDDAEPSVSVFQWSGGNDYFLFSDLEGFGMGGGSGFAFWVGKDFLTGNSSPSETFGNTAPLTRGSEFVLRNFECWAFDRDLAAAVAPSSCGSASSSPAKDAATSPPMSPKDRRRLLRERAADALRFEAFS